MIYFITTKTDPALCKIGVSVDPISRLSTLQVGSPVRLELRAVLDGGQREEQQLHAKYDADRAHGEWFHLSAQLEAEIRAGLTAVPQAGVGKYVPLPYSIPSTNSAAESAFPSAPEATGLTGMYLHTLNSDREIEWQGRIIGKQDDDWLVQLFSYLDGSPSNVVVISNERLRDHRQVVLYRSSRDMRIGYYRRECPHFDAIEMADMDERFHGECA